VLRRTFIVERYNTKKKPAKVCSNNCGQERCPKAFKHPPYVTPNLWGWYAFLGSWPNPKRSTFDHYMLKVGEEKNAEFGWQQAE
jgi:hypothetical protein